MNARQATCPWNNYKPLNTWGENHAHQQSLWIIQKSNKSNHNNPEKLYMHEYIHIRNQEIEKDGAGVEGMVDMNVQTLTP